MKDVTLHTRLGDLARTTRRARGLAVEAVASAADMSPVTWRRIERGQGFYESTRLKLAEYFGVPAADLEKALADEDAMVGLEARVAQAFRQAAPQHTLWRLIEISVAARRMRVLSATPRLRGVAP